MHTTNKEKDNHHYSFFYLLGTSQESVLFVNRTGTIVAINETASTQQNYFSTDLLHRTLFEIFPTLTLMEWLALWKELVEHQHFIREIELLDQQGGLVRVDLEYRLLGAEDEAICCLILGNPERFFSRLAIWAPTVVENAFFPSFFFDLEGYLLTCNMAGRYWLGAIDSGTHVERIFSELAPEYWTPWFEQLRQKKSWTAALRVRGGAAPGEDQEQQVYAVYLSNTEQTVVGMYWLPVSGDLEAAREEISYLKSQLDERQQYWLQEDLAGEHFGQILTQNEQYKRLLQQVARVAETDSTVLILGETGTGKGLVARAIHSFSMRASQPLVTINCAALPEHLIESELFGHEKGAFTGAYQRKLGRFELAHEGTIFLDEIGELPVALQPKLLRVLQEGEFERVGGAKTLKVDVRIIAATNRRLERLIESGKFREDLYYRLNVFPIVNLPLRERRDDIPLLIDFFMRKFGEKTGRAVSEISQRQMEWLMNYPFPGNIRELENMVERAVILSTGKRLNLEAIIDGIRASALERKSTFPTFLEQQRLHIIDALRESGGNLKEAAGLLELPQQDLKEKIRAFKIKDQEYH